MTVLVIDGSQPIIDRWLSILSETDNVEKVYGALSYNDAVKIFAKINPGIILLDSGLPENETFDLLKEVKNSGSKTAVIVLSNRFDDYTEEQCKRFGADFFLDKYLEFEKVPEIIREIAEDEKRIK